MRHSFSLGVFFLFLMLALGAGCNQGGSVPSAQPEAEEPVSEQPGLEAVQAVSYALEEVQKHATAEDCWLVIDGKVYNVTAVIGQHPGGEAILNGCGKDATQMFAGIKQGQGHSNKAKNWLNDLYIGELKNDTSFQDSDFEFYSAQGPWKEYFYQGTGLSFEYPEQWIMEVDQSAAGFTFSNIKPNDMPDRGGLPDGAIKIDVSKNSEITLDEVIDCNQEIDGLVSCQEVVINGVNYRKLIQDSEGHGETRMVYLASSLQDGVLSAVGFAPAGSSQSESVEVINKIFETFKIK